MMTRKTRGMYLIGGLIGVALLTVVMFSLVGKSPAQDTTATTKTAASPATPVRDTNDTANVGSDFSALNAAGVSARQIDGLQFAIFKFAQPQNIPVKNVAVKSESVQHTVSDDGTGTYTFVLKFDDSKSYKATMQASGLYTIRLYLYDTNGKQIYDSTSVDATKLN